MSASDYANDTERMEHLSRRLRGAESNAETYRLMAGQALARERELREALQGVGDLIAAALKNERTVLDSHDEVTP